MEHYSAKFGRDKIQAMIPRMENLCLSEDPPIHMKFGGVMGSTLDSQMLIAWAGLPDKPEGLAAAVVEELFKIYFTELKSIHDRIVLNEVIARVMGNNDALRKEAEQIFNNSELEDLVRSEADEYRKGYCVSGVPFFVIDNEYGVSGCQDVSSLVDLFLKLAEDAGVAITLAPGQQCGGHDCNEGSLGGSDSGTDCGKSH